MQDQGQLHHINHTNTLTYLAYEDFKGESLSQDDSTQYEPRYAPRCLLPAGISRSQPLRRWKTNQSLYREALIYLQTCLLDGQSGGGPCNYAQLFEPLGRASGANFIQFYQIHRGMSGFLQASSQAIWCAPGWVSSNVIFEPVPIEQSYNDWLQLLTVGEEICLCQTDLDQMMFPLIQQWPYAVSSWLWLPLMVRGSLIGVLGVVHCQDQKDWEQFEIDTFRQAAQALANVHDQLGRLQGLKQAESKYRNIVENSVDGIFQSTVEGQYTTVNASLATLYGYASPADLMTHVTNIADQIYVHAADRQRFKQLIAQSRGRLTEFEVEVYRQDGSTLWVSESARTLHDDRGRVIGYEGTVKDVTARKSAEAQLIRRDRLLRSVVEATTCLLTNPSLEESLPNVLSLLATAIDTERIYIYEWSTHPENVDLTLGLRGEWRLPHSEPCKPWLHYAQPGQELERRWVNRVYRGEVIEGWDDGLLGVVRQLHQRFQIQSVLMVPIWVDQVLWGYIGLDDSHHQRPWTAHESSILTSVARSIGGAIQRQLTESSIRHQAFQDLLTGLPNRNLFNQQLASEIAIAQQNQEILAVLFLNLDHFKAINDSLGHTAGDQLLQQVARRLESVLRKRDFLARWGGDEFTLILPKLKTLESAHKIAQRLYDVLQAPFSLKNKQLTVEGSLGIALFPTDGETAQELVNKADAAMYVAKDSGRNTCAFYSMPAATVEEPSTAPQTALEESLRRAVNSQEFVLYYQPQINLAAGEVQRAEALIRWQHPELGVMSPQTFMDAAEESGLIVPMGRWVLREACLQNRAWQKAGLSPLRVSVNLSAKQLQEKDLVQQISQILAETGLAPEYLELEITETAAMQDFHQALSVLKTLKEMGLYISLDDFGTGYSSLSYLKKFPLNCLKIDQSFIQDMGQEDKDIAMIRAIIGLGRGLNLNVVAEGVETLAQVNLLRSQQCYDIQGYWFSQPLSASAMTDFLTQNRHQEALASIDWQLPLLD